MTKRTWFGVAVVVAGLTWLLLALYVRPTGESGSPAGVRAHWSPHPVALAIWLSGLLALTLASWRPLIGVMVLFAFEYAVPRYTTEYQLMLQLRLPELTAILTLWGWQVWRSARTGQLESGVGVLGWLLGALVCWVAICTVAAIWSAEPWIPERTQHPTRFAVAALAFLVSSSTLQSGSALRALALTLPVCLIVRAIANPAAVAHDNDIGALVAIAVPFAVLPLLQGAGRTRVLALCLVLALMAILALTLNRGGVVGLGAAAVALAVMAPSWKIRSAAGVVLVCALAVPLGVESYRARFQELIATGVRAGSAGDRLELWGAAGRMVRDRPLVGVGPGNFAARVREYSPSSERLGAHNSVIAMFAETGIPGGALFIVLFGTGVLLAWRHAWSAAGWRATAAVAVGAALVGYLGAGLFMGRQTQVVAYALLGAVVGLRTRYSTEP